MPFLRLPLLKNNIMLYNYVVLGGNMKKKSQIIEKTKRNLINSFWNLYKNEDIIKITIKDICDCADYDRTTFYRYFNNRNDILDELENEFINNIKNSIDKAPSKKNNSILFDGFNRFNENYGEYIAIFCKKNNYSFYNKFKKIIKEDVFNYFKFNIKDTKKEEFVFEFIFSSLISSYVYWYNHKDIMDLNSFVKFANNVILNGINIILKDS